MHQRLLMATLLRLVLLLATACVCTVVHADPANGFALYFGPVHGSIPDQNLTSNGLSLNADAQMAVNAHWSLNPYLELSHENTNSNYSLLNGSAGLQARYWLGHWFLAGQYLFHSENRRSNGTITAGIYGAALGLAAGWEGNEHWTIMLEINSFEGQGVNLSTHDSRTDARIQIGYRWY